MIIERNNNRYCVKLYIVTYLNKWWTYYIHKEVPDPSFFNRKKKKWIEIHCDPYSSGSCFRAFSSQPEETLIKIFTARIDQWEKEHDPVYIAQQTIKQLNAKQEWDAFEQKMKNTF